MSRLNDLKDLTRAIELAFNRNYQNLLREWLYVPFGITITLVACFGIDVLFKHLNVSFPASVACLVLLFLVLIGCETALGSHRTRKLVAVIEVSAGWSLKWMGIFFTPSFVLLPLSPPIGVIEVFKIIAVFIIGFFIMMLLAAYLTRALQLLLGNPKRAESARAEELGTRTPDIPFSANNTPPLSGFNTPDLSRRTSFSQAGSVVPLVPVSESRPQSPPQLRLQEHHYANGHTLENAAEALSRPDYPSQIPLPPPRAEQWAARISANLDLSTFIALFFLVGIPLYYGTGYAMPIQLSVNILAYFAAISLPASWRQYLHPVLVCSLFTVLILWSLAAIRNDSLSDALHAYRTGAKYLQLWENTTSHTLPGAGDVFGTLLDASIVALALPMFQYRRELRSHFLSIVIPNVVISVGSLFAYPPLCFAIGIAADRSLAFASRSLTLALAVPATENLGGDVNTVAALAIISGILGVVFGQRILAFLRIPEDDYVTRGVTLGVNSSAIATAVLLRTDPRAAALSSLSMSLFGTVTVLFTSIPPVAAIIRSLVGL
ncbi:Fc.00g028570.m01.CDS01 [Cosmosporella sp. VM-42]